MVGYRHRPICASELPRAVAVQDKHPEPQSAHRSSPRLTKLAALVATIICAASRAVDGGLVLAGHVSRVSDGDTVTVVLTSGPVRVRLDGIDAPELDMPGGAAARIELERLALGQEVQIRVQSQDRYERLVGSLYVKGTHINAALIDRGHAWAYREYLRADTRDSFCELESIARAARRGLWATAAVTYPSEWRSAKRRKTEPPARSRESVTVEECRRPR